MIFAAPNKLGIIGDQKTILAHFCTKLARKVYFFAQYFGEILNLGLHADLFLPAVENKQIFLC